MKTKPNRQTGLSPTTKIQLLITRREGGLSTRRPALKTNYNEKENSLFGRLYLPAASSAYAQGNGMAGITEATNMVTSYFDPGTKLIYAIGAVVGLIGGVKVYKKFSSGRP